MMTVPAFRKPSATMSSVRSTGSIRRAIRAPAGSASASPSHGISRAAMAARSCWRIRRRAASAFVCTFHDRNIMELTFIGCGNAFGDGGRFNTCFLLEGSERRLLIDCGASSLVGMRKLGIDPHSIDGIVLSHLHGDHFGGLPFLLLEQQHMSKRTRGLFIFGPAGLPARLDEAQEVLF